MKVLWDGRFIRVTPSGVTLINRVFSAVSGGGSSGLQSERRLAARGIDQKWRQVRPVPCCRLRAARK